MPQIDNFESAQDYLLYELPVTNRESEQGRAAELAFSQEFFAELGDPQESFRSIHIAGTSGKGSTSFLTSGLLRAHGSKVGTLISPHVRDIRERAMVDLALTDREFFIDGARDVAEAAERLAARGRGGPRFTEVFVGLGFVVCERADVDYAVVETVMGGRYDATNTIQRGDKQAIITSLGLDHEGMLGNTIEEIAWHKAGIMSADGQASAFLPDTTSVQAVLEGEARTKNTNLEFTDPSSVTRNVRIDGSGVEFDYESGGLEIRDITLPTLASYQVKNAALAIDSFRMVAERDGITINPQAIRQELGSLRIPARLEVNEISDRRVVIDGATNPQKLQYLIDALKDAGIAPPIWVFGAGIKKDHGELFSILEGYADSIVFSDYDRKEAPHLQGKSADARELERLWKARTDIPCLGATHTVNEAFAKAYEGNPDKHIVIAGSVYMIGEFEPEAFAEETASEAVQVNQGRQNGLSMLSGRQVMPQHSV